MKNPPYTAYILPNVSMGCSVGMNPYATRTREPRKAKNQGLHSLIDCHTSQPPPTSATPAKINKHIVMMTVLAVQLVVDDSSSLHVDMLSRLPLLSRLGFKQSQEESTARVKYCDTKYFHRYCSTWNENASPAVERKGDPLALVAFVITISRANLKQLTDYTL